MVDSTLSYDIVAGDVVIATAPLEMLPKAREEFPETIGYRFIRAQSNNDSDVEL